MTDDPNRAQAETSKAAAAFDDIPEFVPRMDMREIFQQMIRHELRNGRLTPWRRRRIVRYAARLGLSAVEAGRFITDCRKAALESDDHEERLHALRLVEPARERIPGPYKIAMIITGAILLDVLLICWLW